MGKLVYLKWILLVWIWPTLAIAQVSHQFSISDMTQFFSDFQKYADEIRVASGVPGIAIAIVQNNEIVFSQGLGHCNGYVSKPIDAHTIFHISSVTKTFIATLMGILDDEKKLNWNDPVTNYLPTFSLYDPSVTQLFTIKDLFTMSTGLPANATNAQAVLGYDQAHLIHSLHYIKPTGDFRSTFAYQDIMYVIAKLILERTSHKKWGGLLDEKIFKPLHMYDSSTTLNGYLKSKNVAVRYRPKNNKIIGLYDWPEYVNWNAEWGINYTTAAGATGINSSAWDLAQWLKLQLSEGTINDKQIISKNNLTYIHAPQTAMGELFGKGTTSYYSHGWVYTNYKPYPIIWHNGKSSYFHSMITIVPQARLGIVILANDGETTLPEYLTLHFIDLYFKKSSQDWSKEPVISKRISIPNKPVNFIPSSLPLNSYIGYYFNEIYGQISVKQSGAKLILTIGPMRVKIPFIPQGNHQFQLIWQSPTASWQGITSGDVYFDVNEVQEVMKMRIEPFNEADGSGNFIKN